MNGKPHMPPWEEQIRRDLDGARRRFEEQLARQGANVGIRPAVVAALIRWRRSAWMGTGAQARDMALSAQATEAEVARSWEVQNAIMKAIGAWWVEECGE